MTLRVCDRALEVESQILFGGSFHEVSIGNWIRITGTRTRRILAGGSRSDGSGDFRRANVRRQVGPPVKQPGDRHPR